MFSLPDKPGPPEDIKVKELTENSVTLTWSPPRDDGGAPITKYVTERREANKRSWGNAVTTPAGKELEVKITGLTEGQSYVFQIAAENEVGRGEYAESKPITPKSQFGRYLIDGVHHCAIAFWRRNKG